MPKVIFLCLFVSVSFSFSDQLIDQNIHLRCLAILIFSLPLVLFQRGIQLGFGDILLFAYVCFSWLSISWSLNAPEAIFHSVRTSTYLIVLFSIRAFVRQHGELILGQMLIAVVVLILLVNGYLMFDARLDLDAFNGTSAHPNLLASYLFLFIPVVLYFQKRLDGHFKWIAILSLGGILIVFGLLRTRSVLLATLVFTALLAAFQFRKQLRQKPLIPIAFVLFAMVFGFLFRDEFLDTISMQERVFVWKRTLKLIADNWAIGVGAGNWEFLYTMFGIAGFDTLEVYGVKILRPHNDFFWVLAEFGIVGFLLIAGFFATLFYDSYKSKIDRDKMVLVIGLLSFFVISFFSFPKERFEHILMVFTLIALIQPQITGVKLWETNKRWPQLILFGMAAIGIGIGVVRLQSEYSAKKMLRAANDERYEEVIAHGAEAKSSLYNVLPGGTPIAAYEAKAHYRVKNKSEFLELNEEAYKLTPYNYEVMSNYGMVLNSKRQYAEAAEVLLSANKINPRYDGAIFNLAIVYYNMGEYKKAKEWIDQVHFKSEMTDYYAGLISQKLSETD